jgi:hypothetical protein
MIPQLSTRICKIDPLFGATVVAKTLKYQPAMAIEKPDGRSNKVANVGKAFLGGVATAVGDFHGRQIGDFANFA